MFTNNQWHLADMAWSCVTIMQNAKCNYSMRYLGRLVRVLRPNHATLWAGGNTSVEPLFESLLSPLELRRLST